MTTDLSNVATGLWPAERKPIRSMSPRQQIDAYALRDGWDETPWVTDGIRFDHPDLMSPSFYPASIFFPRESRIPAPDPYPWLRPGADTITDARKSVRVFTYQEYRPRPWPELRAAGVTREPREWNPILAAFREHPEPRDIEAFVYGVSRYEENWLTLSTPAQVAEARIVLSRLQSVIEASRG